MKKICASDNASEKVNAVKEAYDKLISTLDRIGDNWIEDSEETHARYVKQRNMIFLLVYDFLLGFTTQKGFDYTDKDAWKSASEAKQIAYQAASAELDSQFSIESPIQGGHIPPKNAVYYVMLPETATEETSSIPSIEKAARVRHKVNLENIIYQDTDLLNDAVLLFVEKRLNNYTPQKGKLGSFTKYNLGFAISDTAKKYRKGLPAIETPEGDFVNYTPVPLDAPLNAGEDGDSSTLGSQIAGDNGNMEQNAEEERDPYCTALIAAMINFLNAKSIGKDDKGDRVVLIKMLFSEQLACGMKEGIEIPCEKGTQESDKPEPLRIFTSKLRDVWEASCPAYLNHFFSQPISYNSISDLREIPLKKNADFGISPFDDELAFRKTNAHIAFKLRWLHNNVPLSFFDETNLLQIIDDKASKWKNYKKQYSNYLYDFLNSLGVKRRIIKVDEAVSRNQKKGTYTGDDGK